MTMIGKNTNFLELIFINILKFSVVIEPPKNFLTGPNI